MYITFFSDFLHKCKCPKCQIEHQKLHDWVFGVQLCSQEKNVLANAEKYKPGLGGGGRKFLRAGGRAKNQPWGGGANFGYFSFTIYDLTASQWHKIFVYPIRRLVWFNCSQDQKWHSMFHCKFRTCRISVWFFVYSLRSQWHSMFQCKFRTSRISMWFFVYFISFGLRVSLPLYFFLVVYSS